MATQTDLYQQLINQLDNELNQSTINAENVVRLSKAIGDLTSSVKGNLVTALAGEVISVNDCVFIARENNPDSYTVGRAYKTNSDYTSRSTEAVIIGIAKNGGNVGASITLQIDGVVSDLSGLVIGENYWMGNTTGVLVKSTTGVVNKVLVGKAASSSQLQLYTKQERKLYEHVGFISENNYSGSRIYLAGGYTTAAVNTIDKLTSDTNCNSISATLSISKYLHASATISTSAYFASGNITQTTVIDKVSSDILCGAISATLNPGRYTLSGIAISSSAYFAGGYTSAGRTASINKLTNDTTCGTISATLTIGKQGLGSALLSTSVYFVGGQDSNTRNYIDKLVSESTCSQISATLSAGYQNITDATISSSAYLACPTSDTGITTNVINKLVSDTSCAAISATMSVPRNTSASDTISSTAYFVGGYVSVLGGVGGGSVNVIDKLVSDTSCSGVVAKLSSSRYGLSGTTV
jgi:hypothetical protein